MLKKSSDDNEKIIGMQNISHLPSYMPSQSTHLEFHSIVKTEDSILKTEHSTVKTDDDERADERLMKINNYDNNLLHFDNKCELKKEIVLDVVLKVSSSTSVSTPLHTNQTSIPLSHEQVYIYSTKFCYGFHSHTIDDDCIFIYFYYKEKQNRGK